MNLIKRALLCALQSGSSQALRDIAPGLTLDQLHRLLTGDYEFRWTGETTTSDDGRKLVTYEAVPTGENA